MLGLQQVTTADQFGALPPTTSAPYRLGVLSAQLGELCVPEAVFIMRHDQREFCRGFRSVVGHTLTTKQFLGAQ